MTSEETVMNISTMMASFQKGFPKRPGIIIHDPKMGWPNPQRDLEALGFGFEEESATVLHKTRVCRLNNTVLEGKPKHAVPDEEVPKPGQ